jgi:hypothetical protein
VPVNGERGGAFGPKKERERERESDREMQK